MAQSWRGSGSTREDNLPEHMTVEHFIDQLNSALEHDHEAVSKLVNYRVPCNDKLRDHPTVQVGPDELFGEPEVGLLGILNGIVHDDPDWDGGYVGVIMEEGKIKKFSFLEKERFETNNE